MAGVKLQYSIICQDDKKDRFINPIHGFRPGKASFYVTNKWVWDEREDGEDGFFQVTEVLKGGKAIAVSRSELFNIKLAHTHHNYFEGILFNDRENYRIRVTLFNRDHEKITAGSLEYPVFVR